MAAEGLRALVTDVRSRLRAIVAKEFRDVTETDPGSDHDRMLETGVISAAASRVNIHKSRYSNIMPFDAHRVVLKTSPAAATDFINASHIAFPVLKDERIIATQGPLHPDWHGPDTCGDFWRCAWENDVSVIVGLAKVQKGFSGSSPYWPTGAVGAAVTFDEFTIVLVEEHEVSSDVVQRKLTLSNGSGEIRPVLHLHYQSWPNYGVPATTDGLRLLLRAVEKHRLEPGNVEKCLLVHCSGGVGRTGAFLAAYYALRVLAPISGLDGTVTIQADAVACGIPIAHAVKTMRHQRHPWMVEGDHQYTFAYNAVLDELESRLERL